MGGIKGPLALGILLFVLAASMPGTTAMTARYRDPAVVTMAAPALVIDDIPPKREPPPPRKPIVVDNSLRPGSRGAEVLALEERLAGLRYMVGKVDGVFDASTGHGVMAFQKIEGLRRTGRADPATIARLNVAVTPEPAYRTPPSHIEVDVPRQVVLVVQDGNTAQVLPAVTGNGKKFWHEQRNRYVNAVTPNGRYSIYWKVFEKRVSPLGTLYWPSYFNGGIALHGSPYMVPYPASHGCVRLPMQFAEWFYRNVAPRGMTVYVYGGPAGENPQPYMSDAPATPSPTPSESPTPSPTPTPSESPPPDPTTIVPTTTATTDPSSTS